MELRHKGWATLPIKEYQAIAELSRKASEELAQISEDSADYNQRRGEILLDLDIDIMARLYNVTRDEILDLSYEEVAEMSAAVAWVNDPVPTISTPDEITISGVRYKVVVDMSKFTFGQYLDYQIYQADAFANAAQLMACLLIPLGKTYGKGYDLGQTAVDIAEHMPFATAHSLLCFFAKAQRASVRSSLRSMTKEKRKQMRRATSTQERERLRKEIKALRLYTSHGCHLPSE